MSTRCQIGIYPNKDAKITDFEILLYKHHDGYEEGVLPLIEPFCKAFNKKRGLSDSEYAGAWLIYELIDEAVKSNIKSAKEYDFIPKNGKDFVGYGICGDQKIHGDIEFYYAIYPDRIDVYKVGYDQKREDMIRWHRINTIPL